MLKRMLPMLVASLALACAAAADPAANERLPFAGTWVLNLAKSDYPPGRAPRSETFRTEVLPDGRVKSTVDMVGPDGKAMHDETIYRIDGKVYPMTVPPSAPGFLPDAYSFARLRPDTLRSTAMRNGKVIGTTTIVVLPGGLTQTVTSKSASPNAKLPRIVAFFDRQP